MRLTKVRVENFKCVEDSTEFEVDNITCLVGKNESGKTALLESLYKLNPVEEEEKDFERSEYPRRYLTTLRESSGADDANVLTTAWELDDDDKAAVNDALGGTGFDANEVVLKKGFDNVLMWTFRLDEQAICKALLAEAKLNAAESSAVGSIESVSQLRDALNGISTCTQKHEALLQKVRDRFPKSAYATARKALIGRMPKFLYYDQYYALPGFVSLTDLKIRKQGSDPARPLRLCDRVFLALLDMTSASLDEIEKIGETEALITELEAIQNALTDEIFKYWTQNRHLDVNFRMDAARPAAPPPFNEGWCFSTRIHNQRHRTTVNFNNRSAGFVWFFSFLVWFSQVKRNFGDNLILLLDEPGLSLHGKAQKDLLCYFDQELRPEHQMIYTTHSPFMIDMANIFSLRTVQDVTTVDEDGSEKILGTKVGGRIWERGADTLFPLQGVVGFDIAQTMFVGPYVLVVEGPSEAAAIQWASRRLIEKGQPGLDLRWAVCPADGATKVASFVTLFHGRGLKIAALFDFHDGQKKMVNDLEKSGLLETGHLLKVSDFVDQSEADIEDLFGREFYCALVNRVLKLPDERQFPVDRPDGAPVRLVKEVEKHCALLPPAFPEFDHFLPIGHLTRLGSTEVDGLPGVDDALARFQEVFDRLNTLLDADNDGLS